MGFNFLQVGYNFTNLIKVQCETRRLREGIYAQNLQCVSLWVFGF